MTYCCRQVLPQGIDEIVVAALIEEHGNDCQLAIGTLVYQMGFQGILLAIQPVFTGTVEVKLQQLKGFAVETDGITGSHVHLYGMAVVDDIE